MTKRHSLKEGDSVLALASTCEYILFNWYLGWIICNFSSVSITTIQHMACACLVRLWGHTKGNWRWSFVMDKCKPQHRHTDTCCWIAMITITSCVNSQLVPPTYCFRITKKYYEAAVEYIALKVQDELQQHTAEGH